MMLIWIDIETGGIEMSLPYFDMIQIECLVIINIWNLKMMGNKK